MGELLGKGQFGKVYRGMITWQGVPAARQKQFDRDSLIPVAIKMIKGRKYYRVHLTTQGRPIYI